MKRWITYVTIVSLLLTPAGPVAVAAAAPGDTSVDGGWPRAFTAPSGATIILYQPQVGSWPDQKHMTIFAAVSHQAKDKPTPSVGALKIEADTSVALADRLVNFSEFTITTASFPAVPKEEVKSIVDDILAAVPRDQRVIGLDRVLAMVDTSQVTPKNTEGIKADPPPIFFSDTPAVLVNLDGPAIWSPIPGTDLRFAVNTNWDLFEYREAKSYYLRVDKSWMVAESVDGPWRRAMTLPPIFAMLPDDGNWADVRAALKPDTTAAMPKVFVSTMPAELLLFSGPVKYSPVTGTGLLWASNTDADVFRAGPQGAVYFLVSGRWFSAPDFSGPWTFATPSLPADFTRIPLSHPRSRVLASVPGTRQALEAVLLSQIPQTATVSRKEISAPMAAYAGEPQFEPIEKTTVARAVNTDQQILKVGDLYYMCTDGVWFMSSTPKGPWTLADSIPKDIYQIPISSPAHNVTYVTVEDSNDDEVVFAAEAAYLGMMTAWGCAVWGSGWYYPPYYYGGAYYPAYFPSYPSYGYGARYNPWTGAYSRGGAVYGPYGGAGYGARYNPSTGTWARGAAAYGPNGARGAIAAYNPRTGTAGASIRGSNVYGSWGSTAVRRGDDWARASHVTRNATGTTIGRTRSGDVYAGRDGNIYRNQGGSWQKYGNGGWSNAERPVGTTGQVRDATRAAQSGANRETINQLNRDRSSRADGAQRTRDFDRGSRSGGGSYRPGGGFGGGGGGFRGGGGGFRGGGRR